MKADQRQPTFSELYEEDVERMAGLQSNVAARCKATHTEKSTAVSVMLNSTVLSLFTYE